MGGETQVPGDEGDRSYTRGDGGADVCSEQISKLSVSAVEDETREERSTKLSPAEQGLQTFATHPPEEHNRDALSSPSEKSEEKGESAPLPPRKQAGLATPEFMVSSEPEFTIEASSWPTLAEALHVKSSQIGSLIAKKEVPKPSVSLPAQRVSLKVSPKQQVHSQERTMEASKHSNLSSFVPGPKYKPMYKKGGFGKQGFAANENLSVPSMGVNVPSANMFVADQSMKGNTLMGGTNNFFSGPHQALAHGPYYYPRAEGLVHFPHNSPALPMYGQGLPGWQQYGRGYGDATYKQTGFVLPYDQQHVGVRFARPLVNPSMSMNVAHYNYPNYQGDMSYIRGAPPHGFGYAMPYFGPPGPQAAMVHASNDSPSVQELLQRQIEFYFSTENLCHDTFLRSRMDEEGFVPLSLIASFRRVRNLTSDTMLILEAMKKSTVVELKNGKLRSHDWKRWKPISLGASGMQFDERQKSSGPHYHTVSETKRAHGHKEREGSQHGHFDTLSEATRMVASSCVAPWVGMPANFGVVSMPAVTSIDTR